MFSCIFRIMSKHKVQCIGDWQMTLQISLFLFSDFGFIHQFSCRSMSQLISNVTSAHWFTRQLSKAFLSKKVKINSKNIDFFFLEKREMQIERRVTSLFIFFVLEQLEEEKCVYGQWSHIKQCDEETNKRLLLFSILMFASPCWRFSHTFMVCLIEFRVGKNM